MPSPASDLLDYDWLSELGPVLLAQTAWHDGSYDQSVWFHLRYRPRGPFVISCGAGLLSTLVQHFRISPFLIQRLGRIRDDSGRPCFSESFLNYLQRLRFRAEVWAAPEGTLLLPDEPIAIARGPKAQVLLLTAPMTHLVWASTHWATLAAQERWQQGVLSEEDTPILSSLGMPPEGWARRAAYIGAATVEAIPQLLQHPLPSPESDEGFVPAFLGYTTSEGHFKPLVQVRRTYRSSYPQGDIWLTAAQEESASVSKTSAHILDVQIHRVRTLRFTRFQHLYQPVLLSGYPVLTNTKTPYLRQRTLQQLRAFCSKKLSRYPRGWFFDATP